MTGRSIRNLHRPEPKILKDSIKHLFSKRSIIGVLMFSSKDSSEETDEGDRKEDLKLLRVYFI